MTAHDLFIKALAHMRHTGASWLSDFIQLWLEPEYRIECWFSGENEQVRVWEFRVHCDADALKLTEALPDAVRRSVTPLGITYRVRVDKV